MFCIYLRTNSDLCHLQHKLIGFYNPDEKCLQRGTDWVFKYSGLRFVFKGLNTQSNNVCYSTHVPHRPIYKDLTIPKLIFLFTYIPVAMKTLLKLTWVFNRITSILSSTCFYHMYVYVFLEM